MSKAAAKEKKSFSKKLFRRGSARSVGSFMSRVLKTLSTLSHFGTEEAAEDDKDDGGFKNFRAAEAGAAMGLGIGLGPGVGVVSSASSIIMMMSGINPAAGRCAAAGHSDSSESGLSGDRWQPPGVAGLKNHGNTCFMNAVLQCLSNTELFAEFLALEQYRERPPGWPDPSEGAETQRREAEDEEELDKTCKSNGVLFRSRPQADMRGEVTEQLASLVRALWTAEYTPQLSREFKISSVFPGFQNSDVLMECCLVGTAVFEQRRGNRTVAAYGVF